MSFESDEYESELSSDEDQLDNDAYRSTAEEFQLFDSLKAPRNTTYSAHHLYEQLRIENIDLRAEYQRDVVWQENKQIALIDSILRNFYVPPVIFSVLTYEDGSEQRICIDGKQRLTSIWSFIDGRIPHKCHRTKQLFWFKDDPRFGPINTKKKLLPDKYKRLFQTRQISCIEYSDLTYNNERDIFKRVQMGMPLTPAEKLNVVSTPRSTLARDLVDKLFSKEKGIGQQIAGKGKERVIPFDVKRGRDLKVVASAMATIDQWDPDQGCKKFLSTGGLETWLSEKVATPSAKGKRKGSKSQPEAVPVPDEFREKMMRTVKKFIRLATDTSYNGPLRQTHYAKNVSPLEMTGILVLIYLLNQSEFNLKKEQISRLIQLLRAHMHKTHIDVRDNSRVAKTLYTFLLEVMQDPEQFLEKNDILMKWALEAPEAGKKPPGKKSGKRARVESQDEGEDDGMQVDKDVASPAKKPRSSTGTGDTSLAQAATTLSLTSPGTRPSRASTLVRAHPSPPASREQLQLPTPPPRQKPFSAISVPPFATFTPPSSGIAGSIRDSAR